MWRNAGIARSGSARALADISLSCSRSSLAARREQAGPRLRPPRRSSPQGLRIALWLDEPLAPTEKAVAAAVHERLGCSPRKALSSRIPRGGFSFAEAYEIFAVLNHAIVAYGCLPRSAIASPRGRPPGRGEIFA